MAARQRSPVFARGGRVPGLFIRTTHDGREVFEFRGRLAGRVTTRVLAATNKTEAVAEAERLRSDSRTRPRAAVVDRRLTVARAAERWRSAVEADPGYSPRTREDLFARLDKYIVPGLGRSKVCDVDEHAVRRFARQLPAMRAKTHRNVMSVLSTLFAWAVAEGLAETNPVARARERWPRDLRRVDAERFQPRALSDDELAAALAKVGGTYRPVVTFIAETGARVSEALGVRYADVDMRGGT